MFQQTVTVNEAAHYLKVQPKTVRAWIAAGKLAASKIGKSYRISAEEMNRVLGMKDVDRELKAYDTERKARIAALKDMLRLSGITQDALKAQRAKDLDLERNKGGEVGLS
ncbi:MAG: helix-turn-helix domain-containing protein [Armatimonadetes bacterium]|nr:helix-turn-helix domain-containing protein [Armatimonadota bacterium]